MEFTEIPRFENSDLETERNVIGYGGFSVVGLWRWKIDRRREGIRKGGYAAVKMLGHLVATPRDVTAVTHEAKILWGLHAECSYIVRLYGLLCNQNKLSLVLEYFVHESVTNFFEVISKGANRAPLEDDNFWPLKIRIACQVCEGMAFLHGKNKPILHRDLKAANVLLDDKLNVKICDFGLATFKRMTKVASNPETSRAHSRRGIAGTISHMAPEILSMEEKWTKECDIYSYGIFLWELITEKIPYGRDVGDRVIALKVGTGSRPQLKDVTEAPLDLLEIMKISWDQEPNKRRHFKDLIPHFSDLYNAWMTSKSVTQALRVWESSQETPLMKAGSLNDLDADRQDMIGSGQQCVESSEESSLSFITQDVPGVVLPSSHRSRKDLNRLESNQLHTNDVCISENSNTDNKEENRPLLAENQTISTEETNSTVTSEPPKPASKKRCIAVISIVAGLVVLAAGTLVPIYFTYMDKSPGCCLNCFNVSDPGLTSNCESHGKSLHGSGPVPAGSVCTFSCKEGYVVNNNNESNLACEETGKWSGAFPYCRKVRECSTLPAPANKGAVQCTNKNYESSKCQFSCPEGSVLKLPGQSGEPGDPYSITCVIDQFANYHWSGVVPYCEKVTTCGPLPATGVTSDCQSPGIGDQYTNGTTCKFSCPSGQSLSQPVHEATCAADGSWNMTSLNCLAACPNFTVPANGSLVKCTLQRKYDSRCNFTCNKNFVKLGAVNMVCRESGKWSNSPPKCVCPACRSGTTCSNTLMFSEVLTLLNDTIYDHKPVNYDGHDITCSILKSVALSEKKMKKLGSKDATTYSCQCRDVKFNKNKQCNGVTSILDSCKNALSSLILVLSDEGFYRLPCDALNLPPPCT